MPACFAWRSLRLAKSKSEFLVKKREGEGDKKTDFDFRRFIVGAFSSCAWKVWVYAVLCHDLDLLWTFNQLHPEYLLQFVMFSLVLNANAWCISWWGVGGFLHDFFGKFLVVDFVVNFWWISVWISGEFRGEFLVNFVVNFWWIFFWCPRCSESMNFHNRFWGAKKIHADEKALQNLKFTKNPQQNPPPEIRQQFSKI